MVVYFGILFLALLLVLYYRNQQRQRNEVYLAPPPPQQQHVYYHREDFYDHSYQINDDQESPKPEQLGLPPPYQQNIAEISHPAPAYSR